jgi:hypothetical protein
MFIHEQSKIATCGAARNESMKMHVKATNCIVLLIVVIVGNLLNIYCYYGAGVQVCDRQPSVRRVLRPTMKTRYDKIRLQNGVLSAASTRAI